MAADLRHDRQHSFCSLVVLLSELAFALPQSLYMEEQVHLLHHLTTTKSILSIVCDATTVVPLPFKRRKPQVKSRVWPKPSNKLWFQEKSDAELHSFTSRFAPGFFNPSTKGNIFKHQSHQPGFACQSTQKPPLLCVFFFLHCKACNNLLSLWLDLNSLTCSCLLDTVSLIGPEHMLGRSNHRASPWCLRANGRREMVSVDLLSPGGGRKCTARTVGTSVVSIVNPLCFGDRTWLRLSMDQKIEALEESWLTDSHSHVPTVPTRHCYQ